MPFTQSYRPLACRSQQVAESATPECAMQAAEAAGAAVQTRVVRQQAPARVPAAQQRGAALAAVRAGEGGSVAQHPALAAAADPLESR